MQKFRVLGHATSAYGSLATLLRSSIIRYFDVYEAISQPWKLHCVAARRMTGLLLLAAVTCLCVTDLGYVLAKVEG